MVHLSNDRIIHKWQIYAERLDTTTADMHLAAIREMERIVGGKDFNQLSVTDVAKVRGSLKSLTESDATRQLSKSTIKHRASYLTDFFKWLLKQPNYKRLPKDLPDYLQLSKSMLSSALPTKQKEYPMLGIAEEMLVNMPNGSLQQKREQAIFALAFLGALRADTLVSLRIQDIDVAGRRIIQDASAVRAKNGKSLIIRWFPVPEIFETVVRDWLGALAELGFRADDALFPSEKWLGSLRKVRRDDRDPVPAMSTKHAITEAFAIACRDSDVKYTPHSARHTIAYERDTRSLTREQRKAWSENMGHASEVTTEANYGKLSDEHRAEVMESIGKIAGCNNIALTDGQKIALVDGLWSKLQAQPSSLLSVDLVAT